MQTESVTLGWHAAATVVVLVVMLAALIRGVAAPDLVLVASLGVLLALGVLTPEEAFAGAANSAVLTVGALFVVAAGVQHTGALAFIDRLLLPRSAHLPAATARLMVSTASMSAFLNNTPVVAMLIPRVRAWCEERGVPTSKLMIPLSFGAILGGMTTLIGTSTNLLVAGLMQASGYPGLTMFDLAWVGVPASLAGIVFFATVGHRLLPDRDDAHARFVDGLKECIFEARVTPGSSLAGRSLEEVGLRALEDAYVVHLRRGDQIIPSSPDALLREGDVLTFLGTASVLDRVLERPGLERVHASIDVTGPTTLPLFEAVVSPTSQLVGRNLRDVGFREEYQGVVLGMHRREAMVEGPLSRVPIRAGDLLLIEAREGFDGRWNENREEFYIVAPRRPAESRPRTGKAPLALAILAGVVAVAALGIAPIVTTAFIGAVAMLAFGCVHGRDARRAVDWSVLVVIAAAIGISRAIEVTGLASAVGHVVTERASVLGAIGVVAAVYLVTSLLTEVVTNSAAAALMVGIGLAASQELGVPPQALGLAVAIAASASFATPIGYQTNLMVLAAGNYRFSDFLLTGLLLNLIVATIAVGMIWWHWL
jgi:di/tricarboxylate transporter